MEHQDIKQIYSQGSGKKPQGERNRAHLAKSRNSAGLGRDGPACWGQPSPHDSDQYLHVPPRSATLAVNHIWMGGEKRCLWSKQAWETSGLMEVPRFVLFCFVLFLLQDFSEPLLLRKCIVNPWDGWQSTFPKMFSVNSPWWSPVRALGNSDLDHGVIFLGKMYFLGKRVMPCGILRIIALSYLQLQQPGGQTSTKELCFSLAKVWPFLSVRSILIMTVRLPIASVFQVQSMTRTCRWPGQCQKCSISCHPQRD